VYTKDLQSQVSEWFSSQNGQYLLEKERQAFNRLCSRVFGFHLLQIGWLDDNQPMLVDSPLQQQILLGQSQFNEVQNYIVADGEQLPVLTDSIDAVLLPHTLDFSNDPQNVLREVERVLIPEGRVILTGFNPVSFWGLQRHFKKKSGQSIPWQGHFVSYTRLHDWLSLLGLDVEQTEVTFYRPYLEKQSFMKRLEFLEKLGSRFWPGFGSVYMIKAVKRVSRLTPIKPTWKRRPRLLANVVEPSTRSLHNRKTTE